LYKKESIKDSSILRSVRKIMVADSLTSIFAIIGGGFFGGLLLGYAFKKVV
jgi:uncharacterized membrane protein (Fun14 family)